MSASFEEKEIERLLKAAGAHVRRKTLHGEQWMLKNGYKIHVSRMHELRAAKNQLARIRRLLGRVEPEQPAAAEPQQPAHTFVVHTQPEPKEEERVALAVVKEEEPKQEEAAAAPASPPNKPTPPGAPVRGAAWKTSWTGKQDKVLAEGFEAGLSDVEIAELMQDVRPGVRDGHVANRRMDLGMHRRKSGTAVAPAAAPPLPPPSLPVVYPGPTALAPAAPLAEGQVRVVFESAKGRREMLVDKATAEQMISLAVSL